LRVAVADLDIDVAEFEHIERLRRELELPVEEVPVMHAKIFTSVIEQFTADEWLDDNECAVLSKLYRCLEKLGWAPDQVP